MTGELPDLSRFELQCLRLLWELEEGTVRDLHDRIEDPPSYSTVRKIVERLEDKGAVERARRDGAAWVYSPTVPRSAMLRKEIRRFVDSVFGGSAEPLLAHLAEMEELDLADIRQLERTLASGAGASVADDPGDDPEEASS